MKVPILVTHKVSTKSHLLTAQHKKKRGMYSPVAGDTIAEHGIAICRSKSAQNPKITACRWIATKHAHTLASRDHIVSIFLLKHGEADVGNRS